MKHSLKTGLSFGLTSAVITTLGLMVGLESGTKSKLAVLGGILTIAIADAFSDAMGIHMSEEAEGEHGPKIIWQATVATFFSKFAFALTFLVPVLLFELGRAIWISVIWGLSILGFFSFKMAKAQKVEPKKAVVEHLLVALTVIVITHYVGEWIALRFG